MAKFTGKNAELLVKNSSATPAFAPVGQIQEIGDISVTAEEVDVTTLDAGDYRDYIQGFKDPGECEFTVIFDPGLTDAAGGGHTDSADDLIGLFDSGDVRDWAIRWNSSAAGGASYGVFQGFLRDMTYGALNADDAQTLSPLLRLTTPIAMVDTLPVTNEEVRAIFTKMRERQLARRAQRGEPTIPPLTGAPTTMPPSAPHLGAR